MSPVKRFVIFGMGRTGSSLLASLLNSHPGILCEGELFRLKRWPTSLRMIARIWQEHPMPYLAYRQMLARLHNPIVAYGFKLHTKLHAQQIADTYGFLHQAHRHGWKIIHLERESLFDQVISTMMSSETGRYFGNDLKSEPTVQVTIPVDTFLTTMQKTVTISHNNRRMLSKIPHIHIGYTSDLAQEVLWQPTVAHICRYLDIPEPAHAYSHISKPWTRPYAQMITNYAELVEATHHETPRAQSDYPAI